MAEDLYKIVEFSIASGIYLDTYMEYDPRYLKSINKDLITAYKEWLDKRYKIFDISKIITGTVYNNAEMHFIVMYK